MRERERDRELLLYSPYVWSIDGTFGPSDVYPQFFSAGETGDVLVLMRFFRVDLFVASLRGLHIGCKRKRERKDRDYSVLLLVFSLFSLVSLPVVYSLGVTSANPRSGATISSCFELSLLLSSVTPPDNPSWYL